MTALHDIQDFLSRKRFAVVGVSRDPKDFTRSLFAELRRRQYDVVPVNPAMSEVDGVPCFAHIGDVSPAPEAALLLTRPAVTDRVVEECAEAGVRQVWMHRGGGTGAVSPAAVRYCESHGIRVIAGECPFMFLPQGEWPHRVHGFFRWLFGKYPR